MGDIHRLTADKCRPPLVAAGIAIHHVVSTRELLDAGLTRAHISYLAAIGFLHPKHQGVWAVGRKGLTFEGRCRAAWLACGGEGSAVSHTSALADHNLRRPWGKIHISGPRSLRGHPDLVLHRPLSLPPQDIIRRDGYAVTTVARTILDMAHGTKVDTVGKWIHEAIVQDVFDHQELWACLERRQGQRGRRVVEAALALEFVDTRSQLEEDVWSIWRLAEMPPAVGNACVWTATGPAEVDLLCALLRLAVEVDGHVVHGTRWRKRRDAEKDALVEATGLKVLRLPELRIKLDPAGVEAEFRHLAATRGRHLSADSRQMPPTA